MPNRLASETSPYLRQHADNPVDWYPWGDDAFARARGEDRPILLSIGYAACHWCHVMAHESFEDEATARLMNDWFVNVKVDREERPDVDAIYMQATQAMTGHGGWPMTVFLTPDGQPFWAGTYFPPEDRHGMPSFRRVLHSIADAWRTQRDKIGRTTEAVAEIYRAAEAAPGSSGTVTRETLERAYRALAGQYDMRHGGFGGAPKFPPTMTLDFLLRYWARNGTEWALEMARTTFVRMARGGIYDQVGGGFARYAVDAVWLVPHFEKMLYDNALLVRLGAHLWQATGDAEIRRATEETLQWVAREKTSPAGGFYSSLDADSEGHEGRFYLWDEAELDTLLGDDAPAMKMVWGVTREGNFEERNILNVAHEPTVTAKRLGMSDADLRATIERARARLYEVRARRVWPGRDEKILAGWNGLMLRGVAEAARAFGTVELRTLALRNGEFLLRELVREDGRVMRSHTDGVTKIPGFLEDHAAVALAFLALHALTFERRWLDAARRTADAIGQWFWDDGTKAFFDTASDAERLITRPRDLTDNAIPSGTSLAVELGLQLADIVGDETWRRRAEWTLETLAEPLGRHPQAFGHMLGAADMVVHGSVELALVGDSGSRDFRALADAAARLYVPSLVVAGAAPGSAEDLALLAGRPARDDGATAYVCRHHACDAPTSDPEELREQLSRAARAATIPA